MAVRMNAFKLVLLYSYYTKLYVVLFYVYTTNLFIETNTFSVTQNDL